MTANELIKTVELTGSPAERGRAMGQVNPVAVKHLLKEHWQDSDTFQSPYFRKNLAFMQREFPQLIEEMEAFGQAVGLTLDESYFCHIYSTGTGDEGCSALAILNLDEGPVMLQTMDAFDAAGAEQYRDKAVAMIHRDLKPHAFTGIGSCLGIIPYRSVNDAGLVVGGASGHPKFNFNDNPETINLYWWARILAQYCGNCADVRHMVRQYRCSGVKGVNALVTDATGNALGIEFESQNIGFREPESSLLLEVNSFQHPDLVTPGRKLQPEFWTSPYYLNSMNRILYMNGNRERFGAMTSLDQFVDFAFEEDQPGRIIQTQGHNIDNWVTGYAIFAQSRAKTLQYHPYPLARDRYQVIS